MDDVNLVRRWSVITVKTISQRGRPTKTWRMILKRMWKVTICAMNDEECA